MLENIRVVLVEPSHPGNIGGACRALKTMGLKELWVVNPERYPDPQAQWRAAGAQDVLDNVRVCDSVDEAIADCHWIVGTSTRSRRIPWPIGDVSEVTADILRQPSTSQVVILFGRETNGLSNEELQRCHQHLQIPANPEYPSLNLAMAVQVVCYELHRQAEGRAPVEAVWDRAPAPAEQTEAMLVGLQGLLERVDFLDPKNPGKAMIRLRRLFTRVEPDETEVQMLRGIVKQLTVALDKGEN